MLLLSVRHRDWGVGGSTGLLLLLWTFATEQSFVFLLTDKNNSEIPYSHMDLENEDSWSGGANVLLAGPLLWNRILIKSKLTSII